MDVQVMLRGRGEPVCSPNRGADESGPMQITDILLNTYLIWRCGAGVNLRVIIGPDT